MTLHQKTLLIIAITVFPLMLILYVTSRTIVLQSFVTLEEQEARRNLERVQAVITEQLNTLHSVNGDWSAWDDTCAFIAGTYPEFIESNLMDATFVNLKLHLMLFLDPAGTLVLGKAFDLAAGHEKPLPQSFLAQIGPDALLLRHPTPESSRAGLVMIPEGPMLVVARPIVDSNNQGPIRGTLIIGRELDAASVEQFARIVNFPLRLYAFTDAQTPPGVMAARDALAGDSSFVTQRLSSKLLMGYTRLDDMYGQPALIAHLSLPRTTYQQGVANIRYFLSFLFAACAVIGLVIVLLLERVVISRLAYLHRSVTTIRTNNDLSMRVTLPGRDELADLSGAINDMLTALEHSQTFLQKLEKAIETSEVGMTITDTQGRIIYTNPADASMHGYTVIELLGQPANIFAAPEEQEQSSAPLDTQDYQHWKRERLNRRKDDSTFPVMLISNPITDARGRMLGKVVVCEDITELKQAEVQLLAAHAELKAKNAQLAELNASKDRFFSIIAHDLRSPFTALLSLTETVLLFLDDYSKEELRANMLSIKSSAEAASALLENLLAWSRFQRGLMTYQPKPVLLTRVVAENFFLVESQAAQKEIQLNMAIAPDMRVYADKSMLETILRNLLSNALKFTPVGGAMTVAARAGATMIAIMVSDTGIGMDVGTVAQLFRLDVQATSIGTAGEKGTGLGLKLCRDLVEKQGGQIWVASAPGKGTTFTFTLPSSPETC